MPNIFDGLEKTELETLKFQLATLEETTIKNVASEMGQKAQQGAVKLFNGLRRLANYEEVKEPKVVSLEERIENKKREFNNLEKTEVLRRMRKALGEKVASAGGMFSDGISDDELSVRVVSLATKCFKKEIAEELSPAQKADAIYQRYNERLVAQAKEKYEKASAEEKKKIDANIKKEFDSMSNEQKEELRKALGVEEITSDTLGKLIKTTAGTTALLVALEASGFGAYMALTTIIHAIFTTTLGITLPFAVYTSATSALSFLLGPGGLLLFVGVEIFMFNRSKKKIAYELLAQIVWTSVLMCGGRFTPKDEVLPSWVPEEQRAVFEAASAELHGVIRESNELNKVHTDLIAKLKQSESVISLKEEYINNLQNQLSETKKNEAAKRCENETLEKQYEKSKMELAKQQKIIDDLQGNIPEADVLESFERVKTEFEESERKLAESKALIESMNKSIDELIYDIDENEKAIEAEKESNLRLQEENTNCKKQIEEMQAVLERLANRERDKLEQRWKTGYPKFIFGSGVIKYVIKNFEYNEYANIERRLMEIHEAKDPAAISGNRGKMVVSGDLHLGFSTPSGFPCRIAYKPLKNNSEGKMVEITEVYKHNDSRRG